MLSAKKSEQTKVMSVSGHSKVSFAIHKTEINMVGEHETEKKSYNYNTCTYNSCELNIPTTTFSTTRHKGSSLHKT